MDNNTGWRINRIRQVLQKGDVAVGAIMQLASPELIEMAGRNGCNFVIIDCEHGSFYVEGAVNMIRAADAVGITPLVRVPDSDPATIMRVLGAGAMGVVVPNAGSAAQVKAVVSAARYKVGDNAGTRGTRASRSWQTSSRLRRRAWKRSAIAGLREVCGY